MSYQIFMRSKTLLILWGASVKMLINITETFDGRYQLLVIAETGTRLDLEYFNSKVEAHAYARLLLRIAK